MRAARSTLSRASTKGRIVALHASFRHSAPSGECGRAVDAPFPAMVGFGQCAGHRRDIFLMDLTSLLIFVGALFVAAASPGPGIAAIVARVLGRGMNGAIAFTAGVALGDVVWLTLAILGLAVVAQTFTVFLAIKYAGAAYLLYLAWKLWTAPVSPMTSRPTPPRQPRAPVPGRARGHARQPEGDGVLSGAAAQHHRPAGRDGVGLAGVVGCYARRAHPGLRQLRCAGCPHAPPVHQRARHAQVNRGSGAVMASAAVAIAAK